MQQPMNLTLVTGATEVLINAGSSRIVKIIPQNSTTGTVTVREASAIGGGSTARWTAPSAGTDFGPYGVAMGSGLTVQLSVAGDQFGIVWGPRI